ncbi:hypothetical protein [Flavobacterium hibisci]|uniref:hypothetical protein n=1 Tax=Flavobacterium hibisci TaxID=1914462 RepID=UPI0004233B82|nr:hypothetical protein [Flavobacterium hibisci]MBZ4041304.1 hypothetical protein [Flavobacterium hibisci]
MRIKIISTKHLFTPNALAPIVVKILFLAPLARKRLKRIAGLAPKKSTYKLITLFGFEYHN